jgi:hypothetical protein
MTPQDLRDLAAKRRAGTQGEWRYWPREDAGPFLGRRQHTVVGFGDNENGRGLFSATGYNDLDREDAAFIAAAGSLSADDFEALADLMERARAALERYDAVLPYIKSADVIMATHSAFGKYDGPEGGLPVGMEPLREVLARIVVDEHVHSAKRGNSDDQ